MNNSSIAITADVLDSEVCRSFWRGKFHPEGPCCPYCHTCLTPQQADTWRDGGKVNCHSCSAWFTWRSETPLHNKSIDERQLYLLVSMVGLNVSTAVIAESCGLSIDTVRRWIQRLQETPVVS